MYARRLQWNPEMLTEATGNEWYSVPRPVFVHLVGMCQSQDGEKNPKRNGGCKIGHVFPKVRAFVGLERRHDRMFC
jgi:hypothetical protein